MLMHKKHSQNRRTTNMNQKNTLLFWHLAQGSFSTFDRLR
jgi:hypothetical protein